MTMANGAPRHNQLGVPKPTKEQEAAAREMLEQVAAAAPQFFELLEVRQFSASLLQIGQDDYVLCFDSPGGRRYAFPMSRQQLDAMSEVFTKAKLGITDQGGPAMPKGAV